MLKKYGYNIETDKYDTIAGLNPSIRLNLNEIGFKIKFSKQNKDANDPFINTYETVNRNGTFEGTQGDIRQNEIIEPKKCQKNISFMANGIEPHFSFNSNRSIDGTKLNPFERKLSDYEFQYEPGHFVLLKQTLIELCNRFDYSDKVDDIINCYDFWIKSTVSELQITRYSKENTLNIWKDHVIFGGGWKYLSKIASRLLSAQASETICERKISSQRYSITNRRQASNDDLVEARFRLSCNKPKNGVVTSLLSIQTEKQKKAKTREKEIKTLLTKK